MMSDDKVAELREQIADLKKRWPAHSVPPAMMECLDTLEEELARELEKGLEKRSSHGFKQDLPKDGGKS